MEPCEYTTLFAQEDGFWWFKGLRRLVEDEARRALPGASPRILDAGCGTGGMTRRLAAHGAVTGLDWSPLALDLARQRGEHQWTRGSVERLPYRTDTFDLVVSLDVLYHRGVESDFAALREFGRCLRPGGTLVLNLPAFESLRSSHDIAVHTARRYRRAPLTTLLRDAGLVPQRVTYWNAFLFPALAAVRRSRRRSPAAEHPIAASDIRQLPGPLNGLLAGILAIERAWLSRWDLPFGLSILAVARKPSRPD